MNEQERELRSAEVTVPCGVYSNEQWIKDITIKEMSGRVLTEISGPNVRGNVQQALERVLCSCIKEIGGQPFTAKTYRHLFGADADFLMLEIRKLTKGSVVTGDITCSSCGMANEVTFDLEDIDNRLPQEGVYTPERDKWLFTCIDTEINVEATFRLPRVMDRMPFMKMLRNNPYKALQQLALSCLVQWNEQTPPFSPSFFEDRPLRYGNWAIEVFQERQVGPDLRLVVFCEGCGQPNDLKLDTSDFLFPRLRSR